MNQPRRGHGREHSWTWASLAEAKEGTPLLKAATAHAGSGTALPLQPACLGRGACHDALLLLCPLPLISHGFFGLQGAQFTGRSPWVTWTCGGQEKRINVGASLMGRACLEDVTHAGWAVIIPPPPKPACPASGLSASCNNSYLPPGLRSPTGLAATYLLQQGKMTVQAPHMKRPAALAMAGRHQDGAAWPAPYRLLADRRGRSGEINHRQRAIMPLPCCAALHRARAHSSPCPPHPT